MKITGLNALYKTFTGLFIILSLSHTAFAKDIVVGSPGNHNDIQPAIQNAVDEALDGDRVILPEGEFVINASVQITKFISFLGKGLKKTILYRSEAVPDSVFSQRDWRYIFFFNIQNDKPSNILVSGICFRGKKPAVAFRGAGSRASTIGVRMFECVDFVIENCRFEYFGNAGISVRHKDTLARGLIRKNEFYYNARFGLGYGVVITSSGKQWVDDPQFGSSNFIFIEDNVFDYHRHSVASSGCALFVVRYNKILNNIAASGGHAIDMHEARPGNGDAFGTRAMEAYNNILINNTYLNNIPIQKENRQDTANKLETAGFGVRNGDALVYNNTVKGYRYAVRLSNWYLGNTQQPYPVVYGPGYKSGKQFGPDHSGSIPPQSDGDVFIWDNKNSPLPDDAADSQASFSNEKPEWWKEGRDYHLAPKPRYKPYPYPYPVSVNK